LGEDINLLLKTIHEKQHSVVGESLKIQVDLSEISKQIKGLKEMKVKKEIVFPDAMKMLSNFAQGINQRKIVLYLIVLIGLLVTGLSYVIVENQKLKPKVDYYVFSKYYFRDSTNYYEGVERAFKNDSVRKLYMSEAWEYDKWLKDTKQAKLEANRAASKAEAAKEKQRKLEHVGF
jgi:hypothetical protein